jgi:RHS repeat-associated protein
MNSLHVLPAILRLARAARHWMIHSGRLLLALSLILPNLAAQPTAAARVESHITGTAQALLHQPPGLASLEISLHKAQRTAARDRALLSSPPGIHIYDYDPDCANPDPTKPEIFPPFSEYYTCGAPIFPWKRVYVCSDGTTVHILMKSDAQGLSPDTGNFFHRPFMQPVFYGNTSIIWKHGSIGRNMTIYDNDFYLSAGKWVFEIWAADLCTDYCDNFGMYYLDITAPRPGFARTWAHESSCLATNADASTADPVNTRSGNYTHQEVDFSLPAPGLPLVFERSYNAQDTADGVLGRGWTHSYNLRLEEDTQTGDQVLVAPRGSRLRFVTDGNGGFTAEAGVLASLEQNQDDSFTLRRGDQVSYLFDEDGTLLSLSDGEGRVTTLTYTDGLLSAITAAGGVSLSLEYDQYEKLWRVSDPEGNQVTYSYTTNYPDITHTYLHTVTDALGETITYTYSTPDGYLETITDPDDNLIMTNQFSSAGEDSFTGWVLTQTNAAQGNWFLAYPLGDGVATAQDPNGNQTTYIYVDGLPTQVTDPLSNTTQYEYDADYNLTALTDPLLHTTQVRWSEDGCNPRVITDTLNNIISIDYDTLNNPIQFVDGRGYTTTYTYSGTLLLSSTDAQGNTASYEYTTSGQGVPPGLLESVTDPRGNTASYEYNAAGQRISMTDALLRETSYTYDQNNRLRTVTDPSGRTDWTCYDGKGRVVRRVENASGDGSDPQTDPCDAQNYEPSADPTQDLIHETVYDRRGNAIASVEWWVEDSQAYSATTRTYYDDANRPVIVVQNLVGQSIEDPDPPAYDPDHPDQNVRSDSQYDANGNLVRAEDNGGRVSYYCYDVLDRVVKSIQNPSVSNPCQSYNPSEDADQDVIQETVYDAAGNAIAVIDPLGIVTRTYYDEANRPVSVVQNLVGQSIEDPDPPEYDPDHPDQNMRSDSEYDANGNLVSATDNAGRVSYSCYDRLNRVVKTIQNPTDPNPCQSYTPSQDADQDIIQETVYDENGNAIAVIDPLGIVTRSYFDALNRPYLAARNVDESYIYEENPPECNQGSGDEYVCTQTLYDDESGAAIAALDPLGRITRTYDDALERPLMVVRNLTAQGYEEETPPSSSEFGNDENVATETRYDARGRAIATIEWWVEASEPVSRTTRTYYDALGRVVSVVRNLTGQAIEDPDPPEYDPDHPDQNVRSDTVYDASGQAIASIQWLADAEGQPIQRVTRTYFDAVGHPILVVRNLDPNWDVLDPDPPDCNRDAEGTQAPYNACTESVYAKNGAAIAVIDPLEHIMRSYYDGLGRVVTVVSNLVGQEIDDPDPPERDPLTPDENVRRDTSYDDAGLRSSVSDPNGVVTAYEYDELNRLTAVIENYQPEGTPSNEVNVRSEYGYDKNGRLLSLRDANAVLNNTQYLTTYAYDDLGRLVSESDPLEHTWSYTYSVSGSRTGMTDAEQVSTGYSYDGLERLVGIDYANDPDVSYAYNALGWRVEMSDGIGTTAWEYDRLGRVFAVTGPYSGTVSYTWDAAGNRTGLEYPDEKTVSYRYDLLGRMTGLSGWDSGQITYTYDIAGSLLATERPNGVASTNQYDDLGRVLTITHTSNNETLSAFVYSYDEAGNRTQAVENVDLLDLIFADGFESGDFSAWSNHTQSEDLVVNETAALTGSYGMQAVIDDNEWLLVRDQTPNGEMHYHARFYFDPNGLSMASGDGFKILMGDMDTSTEVWKVHFRKAQGSYRLDAYVKRDNGTWGTPITTQVTDEVHGVEVEWRASSGAGQDDGLLRLWLDGTQIGQVLSVDNDTYVVDGVRMGVLTPPANTTSGTLCFDAFESRRSSYIGLLEGVQGCGGGQRGQEMMEEEVSDTLEITGTLAVEAMIVELTATLPLTWEMGLTGTVEVTVTEVLSPTLQEEAVSIEAVLAALLETLPSAPQALEDQEDGALTIVYEYDPLNRLTSATYSDGRYFEYTYDSVGNRLSEATDSGTVEYDYDVANRLEYVDGQPYTWDDNGNLLDDGVNTYTYDQANRLLTVSSTEYEIEYEYNGLGDRLWQAVDSETTTYTLDLVSGLTQVLADGTQIYLYGAGRIAQQDTGMTYFLGDALGSVRQLVDESGNITLARGYEPFGEVLEAGGEADSSYGFTGEWTDATGLVYLRARYYAPQDGRFLSRDMWEGDQQRPMSYNAWLYVYANPVNLTDPGGMCPDMNRDGKCDRSWECDLMPSPYREWCWGELGCAGNGGGGWGGSWGGRPDPLSFDCGQMPGYYHPVCNTYLALRDNPGWWNKNSSGTLTPQRFLGLFLRMEFCDYFKAIDEQIKKETTARNFYYLCPYLPGNGCDSYSASDIINYITWKELATTRGRYLLVSRYASAAEISAIWVDDPIRYSSADTFENAFLYPCAWKSGIGSWDVPVDWGNVSMCRSEYYPNHPKKCEPYEEAVNRQVDHQIYLGEDQVYLKSGKGDSALILTYRQLRHWFPDKFP